MLENREGGLMLHHLYDTTYAVHLRDVCGMRLRSLFGQNESPVMRMRLQSHKSHRLPYMLLGFKHLNLVYHY